MSGRIFGPKREEVAGGSKKLHNEELHNLNASLKYYKGDKIKEDEMGGAGSTHGIDEKCVENFYRKN
jgi:hypothetical protein